MAKVREGVVLSGLRGRTGNAVFVSTPNGTVLRDRPLVNDPNTALQRQVRDHLGRASQAWKAMTLDQAAAWRRYAELEAGLSSGARVAPQLVFNRLSIKFLQASPQAPLPLDPPTSLFPGDAVRFSVGFGVSGLGSRGSVCRSVRSSEVGVRKPLPTPNSQLGTGSIEILADRDNAPGVVTEVLLQPLESVHRRTYLSRYRTAGFFAFEQGVPVVIPTEAKVCAVAVRFVCESTGQAMGLVELGIVN